MGMCTRLCAHTNRGIPPGSTFLLIGRGRVRTGGAELPLRGLLGNSEGSGQKEGWGFGPQPFALSFRYSTLVVGSALMVVSSTLGTLAQEVMIAATFSVLR